MNARSAVLGTLALLIPTIAHGQASESDSENSISYTHVYADSAGVSHFRVSSYPATRIDIGNGVTAATFGPIAGNGIQLFCFEPGTFVDWHPAPRPQLYLILSGGLELEASDGELRRFEPGDLILGEATEGKGVRAKWNEAERSCVGIVPLHSP